MVMMIVETKVMRGIVNLHPPDLHVDTTSGNAQVVINVYQGQPRSCIIGDAWEIYYQS